MATDAKRPPGPARADYLGGAPEVGPAISGGRLDFDASGLRFSGPAGDELHVPVDGILGISISGRAAERRRRRALRGTMRVAGMRGAEPAEWLFAIDRSAAATLRRRVDRELSLRGRSLPFVEELDGFPLTQAPRPGAEPAITARRHRRRAPEPEPDSSPSLELSIAELGHRLDGVAARRQSRGRRRLLPWAVLGGVLILVEVVVPLLLIKGGGAGRPSRELAAQRPAITLRASSALALVSSL
jgi:hypothetical protein